MLRNERALLADEMGLGKTVQAIALLASTHAFPAFLVVPPHLVRNWQRELSQFLRLPGGVRVHVLRGLTPYELPQQTSICAITFCCAGGSRRSANTASGRSSSMKFRSCAVRERKNTAPRACWQAHASASSAFRHADL